MLITLHAPNWYCAQYKFTTKHGTQATATGNGYTRAQAIADCLKDYQLITSLTDRSAVYNGIKKELSEVYNIK